MLIKFGCYVLFDSFLILQSKQNLFLLLSMVIPIFGSPLILNHIINNAEFI